MSHQNRNISANVLQKPKSMSKTKDISQDLEKGDIIGLCCVLIQALKKIGLFAVGNWHSPQKFRVAIEEQLEEESLKARRRIKQAKNLIRFTPLDILQKYLAEYSEM